VNIILVEVCHDCEEFHKAIGHWNPQICAKMHLHFGHIWCMASMLAPCDFHPKQNTCALRICGSLDLTLKHIQIPHSPKLPMNITHLLMFINLGRSFPFNINNVQKKYRVQFIEKNKITIYLNVNSVPNNWFSQYFETIIKIYLDYPNNMLLFCITLKNIILPQLLFKIYKEWDPQAHQLYHVFPFNSKRKV